MKTLAGFTLLEMLAVVGLAALATGVAVYSLRGRGVGAGRDAAVAQLVSRLGEARALAADRGLPARLCVCSDLTRPTDFMRRVVVAATNDSGGWHPVDAGSWLPDGFAVLPATALPTDGPGAVRRPGDDWSRGSGGDLRSTALRAYSEDGSGVPLFGTMQWLVIHFSATGGVMSGDVVVAAARPVDPGAPITLEYRAPDDAGGVALSIYGAATTARGRAEF